MRKTRHDIILPGAGAMPLQSCTMAFLRVKLQRAAGELFTSGTAALKPEISNTGKEQPSREDRKEG